ncbi:acyl-CoA N-acyltransferase [Mycena alexandri]|uniref:Acyl-CoA N-acyltransferase n=1 Tax=Mycena alexandri TaxID=1745969 RepID=A0AAD6THE5_9AGAR|nr:acyl-CoA N-acyltransferase [Mycena alexandri]
MDNPQLHPLEMNPKGEPFLRLLSHKNIIITPTRLDDGPAMIPHLNDERVYRWVSSPPHPYLPEHAEWWLNHAKETEDKWFAELKSARDDPTPKIVDFCPVGSIREVLEDGTEVFIGSIVIHLAEQPWELEGTGRLKQETPRRDAGDPDIWTFGDWLAPSHHGRGIMSDAIQTVMQKWAIPRMGVRRIVVTAIEGNAGSVRVFEKNGFAFRKTIADVLNVRGTMRSVHVVEWRLEDEAKMVV